MEVRVQAGDTLWFYSQLFDIPMRLIKASNPHIQAETLKVGDRIQIPGYELTNYTVTSNDSLPSIATKHAFPTNALLLVNDSGNIQAGQKIGIPKRITKLIFSQADQYSYEKLLDDIRRLQEVYPFISSQSIGTSVMGKDLMELQMGVGEKTVHLNAAFHANEWITTPVLMKFINQYALCVTNNIPLDGLYLLPYYINTKLSIVPMVNPDGVNLVLHGADAAGVYKNEVLSINENKNDFSNWKANIRGIDLNKQYPARWKMEVNRKPSMPHPRDYPGPYPLSEPEAFTMAKLTKERDFQRVHAFHTQGQEIYWGFEGIEPEISEELANTYAQASGYSSIRYLDNYAGYKDWFIKAFKRPGFTIELGAGTNPLPITQFDKIYKEAVGILLANLYL